MRTAGSSATSIEVGLARRLGRLIAAVDLGIPLGAILVVLFVVASPTSFFLLFSFAFSFLVDLDSVLFVLIFGLLVSRLLAV